MDRTSKQLALAGRKKPEIRLGMAISDFAACLDEQRRQQFYSMRATGSKHISGLDVIKVTEEINKDGSRW